MNVKIVIKRKVPKEKEKKLLPLIKELRILTTKQPGYISGETMDRADKPGHSLVISTWQNTERWNDWTKSDICKKLTERVKSKLTKPLKITVYNYFVIREKRVWSTF